MGLDSSLFQIASVEREQVWEAEGVPVLRGRAVLPGTEGTGAAARRFRRYYESQLRAALRRWETVLLPRAAGAAREALALSRPLPLWQGELTFQVRLRQDRLLSLTTTLREDLGDRPRLCRWGDTWDLAHGYLLPLSDCFPAGAPWKRQLLQALTADAEARQRAGAAQYREGWQKTLRRRFNPRSYVLTEEGLELFYPQYALTDRGDGCASFLLPYRPEGPFLPKT